jgi:hypothetical protein
LSEIKSHRLIHRDIFKGFMEFTMTDTITRQTLAEPSGVAKLVRIFDKRTDRIEFEDGYIHYIHPSALEGLTGLTVKDLKSARIHFLGKMQGEQVYEGSYRHDSSILNFINCQDLLVTNPSAINTKQFSPGNLTTESSCVVNVQNSRMRFERCRFDSMGKIALSVHSGSYVELDDVILAAYYFELLVAASQVIGARVQFLQDHPDYDSHSAIWVSSSHRQAITNTLFENTNVSIADSVFDMASGRSLVSGNGSYHTRSVLDFQRIKFTPDRDPHFGICRFHENFNSITVTTDFDGIDPLTDKPITDFISTPTKGFAKYVSVNDPDTRPGGGGYQNVDNSAPILIDGLNSNDVVLT